ncbi:kinase-like domain-containing protein [Rhizophagus irregularis DAOM 181602=DAOM 197198]|nr:kinase-like domain-containing protein [Rhizophagus irregularis DAOM 181602=DAOM 197198]
MNDGLIANNQWEREGETKVALKCLHNSQDITADFLKEVESNILVTDPDSDGSLRQYLNNNFISLDWEQKLVNLQAPEVLRGKEYTQESDIYGFGIIAYEICTGLLLYHDIPHDEFLAIKICHGLRPNCDYKIPQLIIDIINQCWDADPLKRPNANELYKSIWKLYEDIISDNKVDSVIYKQVEEADETNKKSSFSVQSPISSASTLSYMTHPQAVYTSRLLNFKDLPEPINADNDDLEYSDSTRIDLTKLDINSEDK